jgi:hypothetical protein
MPLVTHGATTRFHQESKGTMIRRRTHEALWALSVLIVIGGCGGREAHEAVTFDPERDTPARLVALAAFIERIEVLGQSPVAVLTRLQEAP